MKQIIMVFESMKNILADLRIDCEMALDGSWELNPEGFQCMIDAIDETLNEAAKAPSIERLVEERDLLIDALRDLVSQCDAYANNNDMDLPNTYAATQLLKKINDN